MSGIELISGTMLGRMRASCALAAECLVEVGKILDAGITTNDIDRFVHRYFTERDAYPSPLNYRGFPKSVCTSINEVVCHGIPDGSTLRRGDIINVDVTCYLPRQAGFHGDTSATFYIGEASEEARRVTETARRCLELGIGVVRDGARLGDIGAIIQSYAESQQCSVVRDYVGHGIGREFHMPPQVPHFGQQGKGKRLRAGMIFTIEPMINLGTPDTVLDAEDGWTVRTADGKLSAQFEHTILVTKQGAEVLTERKEPLEHSETLPWAQPGPLSAPATVVHKQSTNVVA